MDQFGRKTGRVAMDEVPDKTVFPVGCQGFFQHGKIIQPGCFGNIAHAVKMTLFHQYAGAVIAIDAFINNGETGIC